MALTNHQKIVIDVPSMGLTISRKHGIRDKYKIYSDNAG